MKKRVRSFTMIVENKDAWFRRGVEKFNIK